MSTAHKVAVVTGASQEIGAGFVAGLYVLNRFPEVFSVDAFRRIVRQSVIQVILVVLIEVILFCLFWNLAEKRKCRLANPASPRAGC